MSDEIDQLKRDLYVASMFCLDKGLDVSSETCNRAFSIIEKQQRELTELRRGEFICNRCGIRKDAEFDKPDF